MIAFLVYVCKHPLPSCFPSTLPPSSMLTPSCLRTHGDICLTSHKPPPHTHTHTQASSPSLCSGSAAEKVTGWATIKRVRARRSFVIAAIDADGELLSSVNDKSMKFPSCSHHRDTHDKLFAHTHTQLRLLADAVVLFLACGNLRGEEDMSRFNKIDMDNQTWTVLLCNAGADKNKIKLRKKKKTVREMVLKIQTRGEGVYVLGALAGGVHLQHWY